MPVILEADDLAAWLDPDQTDSDQVLPLLRPSSDDRIIATPVDRHVNNARNDDPQCILPATDVASPF